MGKVKNARRNQRIKRKREGDLHLLALHQLVVRAIILVTIIERKRGEEIGVDQEIEEGIDQDHEILIVRY